MQHQGLTERLDIALNRWKFTGAPSALRGELNAKASHLLSQGKLLRSLVIACFLIPMITALWIAALPLLLMVLLLFCIVAAQLAYTLRWHFALPSRRLSWLADNRWQLSEFSAQEQQAKHTPIDLIQAYDTQLVCFLKFKVGRLRHTALVFNWDLPEIEYHRLRLRLRLRRHGVQSNKQRMPNVSLRSE